MALFFFHFIDGDDRCEDDRGLELASAEVAYLEAVAGARGMVGELMAVRRDPFRCVFEVADDRGNLLFRVPFSELLENCQTVASSRFPSSPNMAAVLRDTHLRANAARAGFADTLSAVRASLAESNGLLARLREIEAGHSGKPGQ